MSKRTVGKKNTDDLIRETLSERVFRAGYVVHRERVRMGNDPPVELESAYTPDGHYIGNPRAARYLVAKRGIRPQLRTPTSGVCSIGYNARERKWYGWSHRAISGFRVGSVVRKDSCLVGEVKGHTLMTLERWKAGDRARTIADAKKMAEAFAESVS